jgi:hypothetical protein
MIAAAAAAFVIRSVKGMPVIPRYAKPVPVCRRSPGISTKPQVRHGNGQMRPPGQCVSRPARTQVIQAKPPCLPFGVRRSAWMSHAKTRKTGEARS